MTNASLSKAIAYLGAVEVTPGRYAFTMLRRDHADWRNFTACVSRYEWFTVSADALAVYSSQEYSEAYWLQAYAKPMPAWWSPEQRIMLRCPSCRGLISRWPKEDAWKVDRCEHCDNILIEPDAGYERITADLQTGAEVPA